MTTIWKYALVRESIHMMRLPVGAVVLHVGLDPQEKLSLWAVLDPNQQETSMRTFHIIGTGHDVPAGGGYLGTVRQGPFMWHVFEQVAR